MNFTGTGGWQRVSVGGTKATATNILRSYVRTRSTAQAITFYVDDALNENAPALSDYFDGSISPDPDLTAAWTGAANQSESVLSAQKPSDFTSGSATNLMYFQSSSWKSTGANSVRLRSAYTATDPGSFISVNNLNAQLVTGRTYTAVAKVRLEAPLSGALRSERLRLQIRTTGGAVAADSNTPPNEAGEYEVRVTWTHNGNSSLRLYHGGVQGSGDVWFDDLMVVEGTYTGPARNGDSPNWIWNGTPHASTSTGPGQ
ncbi:hypothetical protein PYV02_06775 [Leifsonia sp. H3M29-4]|uniref:hypothetical protein n=1 Tax=Salinibacterium metalliresistens TaxID=3031321 RepID=UPI0023DA639D|nr:hypothetical protein [Salinibacterium metalliresistens]MDF1478787.1 hypothetical protein [Salinibacterium metalliresistens]